MDLHIRLPLEVLLRLALKLLGITLGGRTRTTARLFHWMATSSAIRGMNLLAFVDKLYRGMVPYSCS